MSFAVRLSTDLISVEAGATMPLSIEVVNRAEEADRFELEVEGLDPEWTAVPVPTFPIAAGETATEKVFFRTPRTPESQSGNYPFVVKVRSLTSGEQRTVQAVLQVQPYHHISAEISPKRGVIASFKRRNHFTITLMNLGNVEHTLQLLGSDPDDALAFDFDQEQVTLGPGQQKDVGVTVHATSKAFIATVKLHGFSVSARSVDTPSVVAVAQAQLEQRPTLTPTGLVLAVIVLGVAALWWYARPKPPTFVMGLSSSSVDRDQPVSIWWQLTNADRVHISIDNQPFFDNVVTEGKGSVSYTPHGDKPVEIEGFAIGKDRNTPIEKLILNVIVPPPAPDPKIQQFTASATRVKVGESVVFTYKVNDAVKHAFIQPLNQDLNLNASQTQIPITDVGDKTFTLIAENADHKAAQKTITVTGYQESDVKVISFSVTPKDLMDPGGLVTVTWQLGDAVHAEISPNPDPNSNEVNPTKGSFQYWLTKSTTFTLTAKDKNNLAIAPQTIRITVEPPAYTPPGTTTGTTTASPPLMSPSSRGPR